jgi:hypothetical protein
MFTKSKQLCGCSLYLQRGVNTLCMNLQARRETFHLDYGHRSFISSSKLRSQASQLAYASSLACPSLVYDTEASGSEAVTTPEGREKAAVVHMASPFALVLRPGASFSNIFFLPVTFTSGGFVIERSVEYQDGRSYP